MGLFDRIREAKNKAKELAEKASLKLVGKFDSKLIETLEEAEEFSKEQDSPGTKISDKSLGRRSWAEKGIWADTIPSNPAEPWVVAIRYLKEDRKLQVRFASGKVCTYINIPMATAIRMFSCNSPGHFVHEELAPMGYE
jgi:KTSC domain